MERFPEDETTRPFDRVHIKRGVADVQVPVNALPFQSWPKKIRRNIPGCESGGNKFTQCRVVLALLGTYSPLRIYAAHGP